MKERPILFNGEMVRAILEGRKTQTRRVIKPQPTKIETTDIGDGCTQVVWRDKNHSENAGGGGDVLQWMINKRCPYGKPGDLLWVRETWWKIPEPTLRQLRDGADTWPKVEYVATDNNDDYLEWGWKRKPSIHMPRWASRITLRVKSVRVERLQDISEDDAEAEGIRIECGPLSSCGHCNRNEFMKLWDSINASRSYGWKVNPWLWVIEFELALGEGM